MEMKNRDWAHSSKNILSNQLVIPISGVLNRIGIGPIKRPVPYNNLVRLGMMEINSYGIPLH